MLKELSYEDKNLIKGKFLHLLWWDGIGFDVALVEMFNNNSNVFNLDEHKFITTSKRVYDAIKNYPNTYYYESIVSTPAKIINEYADDFDIIIMHGMCGVIEATKIKNKYLKKIVWRTWGTDVEYKVFDSYNIFKIILIIFANIYLKNMYKKFYAIGVANTIDELNIKEKLGNNIRTFCLNYGSGKIDDINLSSFNKDDSCYIMVGHSGFENDEHIYITDIISKFKNENIKVFYPLSYGDKKYINKVKLHAIKMLGSDKICFIENDMDFENYVKFINNMGLIFIGGTCSHALGNIGIAVKLSKTLIVNNKGVIHRGLLKDKIPHFTYDDFNKFLIKNFKIINKYITDSNISLKQNGFYVDQWRYFLNKYNKKDISYNNQCF